MVMERSRDPKTHDVRYPVKPALPGGETDPAGMEIDLWVRSKAQNAHNFPPFETPLSIAAGKKLCGDKHYRRRRKKVRRLRFNLDEPRDLLRENLGVLSNSYLQISHHTL